MAPTGVAAINIDGTTIHTALAIPKESGDNIKPMSDQKRTQIRFALSDLKLIIDKISMVSNTLQQVINSCLQNLVLLQWVICINFHRYEENLSLRNIKIMFTICAILGYFSR
jgi:hypothetical protein